MFTYLVEYLTMQPTPDLFMEKNYIILDIFDRSNDSYVLPIYETTKKKITGTDDIKYPNWRNKNIKLIELSEGKKANISQINTKHIATIYKYITYYKALPVYSCENCKDEVVNELYTHGDKKLCGPCKQIHFCKNCLKHKNNMVSYNNEVICSDCFDTLILKEQYKPFDVTVPPKYLFNQIHDVLLFSSENKKIFCSEDDIIYYQKNRSFTIVKEMKSLKKFFKGVLA